MNDRFRFRAWDKSFNKYCENVIVSTINEKITVYGRLVNGRTQLIPNSHVVLEQCTGLKDKNGNLIYENAIIEIIGNGGKKLHFRVAVSDRNGGYYFPDAPLGYSFDFLDSHLYEVVGNIHENPELLEDK